MQLAAVAKKRSLVNLTPLIDVVFILLIFFMLVTSFTRYSEITLSVAQDEDVVNVDAEQTSSVIKVSTAGTVYFEQQKIDLKQLGDLVRDKLDANRKHIFFIKPADEVLLQDTILVLDELIPLAPSNLSFLRDEAANSS